MRRNKEVHIETLTLTMSGKISYRMFWWHHLRLKRESCHLHSKIVWRSIWASHVHLKPEGRCVHYRKTRERLLSREGCMILLVTSCLNLLLLQQLLSNIQRLIWRKFRIEEGSIISTLINNHLVNACLKQILTHGMKDSNQYITTRAIIKEKHIQI